MKKIITILLLITNVAFAQTKSPAKELAATRTKAKIKIDAELNEDAWKDAAKATNFIEWRPSFSKVENDKNRTDDEISQVLGMETRFLSVEGLYRAFERAGISRKNICSFCIGGARPN